MIIELAREPVATPTGTAWDAARKLGIETDAVYGVGELRRQTYNKIIPIDDESRKRFMLWATNNCHVYSLGRFATWRPGLLLDDLVKDVRLIDKWTRSSGYDMAVHAAR
jgi:diacylglycerol kinase family enzyme